MKFDFDVNPHASILMLDGIASRSADLRPAMMVIRELMLKGHIANFESRGSFLGEPWPALAQSTLERKARQGLPSEPMEASGDLIQALRGGKGKRTRATRTSVSVGVSRDLYYTKMTQKATKTGQPARPVLGMNEAERQAAVTIVQVYLERGEV